MDQKLNEDPCLSISKIYLLQASIAYSKGLHPPPYEANFQVLQS